jgi:hypothetical protein
MQAKTHSNNQGSIKCQPDILFLQICQPDNIEEKITNKQKKKQ